MSSPLILFPMILRTSLLFVSMACLFAACSTGSRSIVRYEAGTESLQQQVAAIRAIDNKIFEAGAFTGKEGGAILYRLLRPAAPEPGKKYPLVVVYHGSGAIGADNAGQMGQLVKLWATEVNRKQFSCYVLAPQFPTRSSNYEQDAGRKVLTSRPQPCLLASLALIDSLKTVLDIDPRRIYVLGFSMGGSTTVNAMAMRPGLFAAGISFSGIPAFADEDKLLPMPLWIIHGNADTENPFDSDALFYKEMMAKGARHIRFWELDKVAHELPPQLTTTTAIPAWLFRQHKK